MISPGSRSSWLITALTDTDTPGRTAPMCALTSSVTCSRSLRRNGLITVDCMAQPPERGADAPFVMKAATSAVRV